ncbi:MAG: AAA family ATPase, partial [Jaaginema sp. PMC 1079.18]|nr:AAA family ATPase [Jaaginema sp. PMC 1079.18]
MVAQFRPKNDIGLPPQNIDLEADILGCLMFDENAWDRLQQLEFEITPDAFFAQDHRIIFRAIQSLRKKGKPSDHMGVLTHLRDKGQYEKIGGNAKLASLMDRTVTAVNFDYHCRTLADKYIRRQLMSAGHDIIDKACDTYSPLKYVCNAVQSLINPIVSPIVANTTEEDFHYNSIIERVKGIQLKEFHAGKRHFRMNKLSKETGWSVKSLENLFFSHMAAEQYEPLLTFDELVNKYGKDTQKWIVSGLIPRGSLTEIFAAPGDGKTLLTYDLLFHSLTGQAWNGFPVSNKELKIVVIQNDESQQATIENLRDRLEGQNYKIYFRTAWSIEQIFQLRQELIDIDPDVLVIDSLSSISRNTGLSENDSAFARNVYALRYMSGELGIATLLIHHANKDGDSRGTSGIPAAVDQVFRLKRLPDSTSSADLRRQLEIKKSRFRCPATYDLELQPETKTWVVTGQADKGLDFDGNTRDQVVGFLDADRGTVYSNRELSEILSIAYNTIRKTTAQLHQERLIEKTRKANHVLYYVPDDNLDKGFEFDSEAQTDLRVIHGSPTDHSEPPQKPEVIQGRITSEPSECKDIEGSDPWITSEITSAPPETEKINDPGSLLLKRPSRLNQNAIAGLIARDRRDR